ncbi:MAG TPA: NAD(P)-dependent oxidoreductase [Solirubrobacteraceae bacterium]|nr:NAD(P)-dependent oxidoreductase [Solirubrobacteraceae bacterium]
MRILVTGARGKVGAATVAALLDAGHHVTALDRTPPAYETPASGAVAYLEGDLADAGQAFAAVRGQDAVIHAAAIPDPLHHAPHVVFANNLMATFNVLEAAVRMGVGRVVHVSSETVPGFAFAERPFLASYAPVDEEHPVRPQDPYALAKRFGEELCDATADRSDVRCISIRPSWVQWEGNVERNLGPVVRGRGEEASPSFWSWIDADDLAEALRLAAESDLPGHEVLYIASPDNATGLPLHDLVRRYHGDAVELRPVERPDASGISTAKAQRLLGWRPRREWRDHLDGDGRLLPAARERLERGETGVQRGRAATG